MAVLKYTGEQLLISVRDVGMVPDAGSTGTEDLDLLKKINEAIRLVLVPRVLKTREDYFVVRERQTLTTASRYRIPHRAMYGKLRDLWYIDTDGERRRLDPIPEEEIHAYDKDSGESEPLGFFLEGHDVALIPPDATSFSGSLEWVYFMRPGDVVLSTETRTISAVNTGTKTITVSSAPPATWAIGTKLDIHTPYSGSELREWDLTIAGLSGSDITVTEAIDGSTYGRKVPASGDYVCLAEEAALPALPRELHPLVGRATALFVAESIGDQAMVQVHNGLLEKGLMDAVGAMESRVEGKPIRLGRRSLIGAR